MATEKDSSSNPAPRQVPKKMIRSNKLFIALIIILVGLSAYFYYKYTTLKADPSKEAQAEVSQLTSQVSKLIVLPEGEQPTIATVTDVEKLKDQPFFAKAKNGDKVLIYTQAKKAILFDPSANKIVEVAPINIGDSNSKSKSSAPISTTPTSSETSSGAKTGN